MKHRKTLDKEVMDRYAADNPNDALVVEIRKAKLAKAAAQAQLRDTTQHLQTLEGFLVLAAAQKYDI